MSGSREAQSRAIMFELPPGSTVGKYEILRKLATGGMAEIYLARASGAAGFEKLVVLKRILPNLATDPAFVSMFLDEARLAATLQHPNIADVYDVGESDGTYFFAMEYVHGQDVRMIRGTTRRRNEAVPLAISLAIVHGAALALDHAHEMIGSDGKPQQLVHRDVSPSNIMVSYDGAVKLLDFGIARASSSAHKTQIGTLKGKIPYMSPEQCKSVPLDRRSDLFSLGIIMYELTVGRRPFRGEGDFAIMDQIVHHGAQPPSLALSGYPELLEAIVMKLLASAPSDRYATAEDLLHDLDAFIAQHQLWLSAKPIGKYMRTLFRDRIAAWEEAQQQGVPLIQHLSETVTSQSQRSELLTPPSMFPAPRISDVMAAVTPSTPQPAAFPSLSHAMPNVTADQPAVEPPTTVALPSPGSYPTLRPRSHKTIVIAFVTTLVLGVGAVGGFMLSNRGETPPSHTAPAVDRPPVEPRPRVEPRVDPIEPVASPAVSAEPPKPETPPAEPADPAIEIAAPPEPAVAPQLPKRPAAGKQLPKRPLKVEPAKPIVKRPTVEPVKPDVPKVEPPKQDKPPNPPKEQPWDPNSPSLPQ